MAQNNQAAEQQPQGSSGKSNKMLIYVGILIVAVIIVGILLFSTIGSGVPSPPSQPQTNTPPVYLSASDAQVLLDSTIVNRTANYTTSTIYNMSVPYNITFLEQVVPALAGNVTNGWVTFAAGSGPNNASVIYTVVQTSNTQAMANLFAQSISASFPSLPNTSNGSENGMNYTYETFTNSTGSFQSLIGWKDGYVGLAQIQANHFTANQSQIAQIVSGNLP